MVQTTGTTSDLGRLCRVLAHDDRTIASRSFHIV